MTIQKRIISISLLFFLFVLEVNAQTVQVVWKVPATVLDSNFKSTEVLYFDGAQTGKDLWPYYVIKINNVAVDNFSLVNTVYQPLSDKENTLVHNRPVPASFIIDVGVQNKRPVSTVSFVPLRTNAQTGVVEKLVSFSYQYTQKNFSIPPVAAHKSKQNLSYSNAKTSLASGSSVLASGQWSKISVSATGLYKIDYNFLKSTGINPDAVDPRNIRIYGNGGGMLPQPNASSRADDLLENSIFIAGEGDGKFDAGDYILFYAQGPDSWTYNVGEGIFNHSKNLYSDNSYYFITVASSSGHRVQAQASLGSAAQSFTYFDDYAFHESDLTNLLSSGREWYGESFDQNTTNSFSFNSSGIIAGSPMKVTSSVISNSTSSTSFAVSVNGATIGSQSLSANRTNYEYDPVASGNRTIFPLTVAGSPPNVTVGLSYNKGFSVSSVGQLDYLEVNMKRTLWLYGSETSFRTIASTAAATTEYQVGNASGATIWQVTDLTDIREQQYTLSGTAAIFSANSTTLEEYVIFSGSTFPAPVFVSAVGNQNLHGINAPGLPDLVIVTYPDFLAEANQLASFRRNNDNMDVVVATTTQVYNEFSSGAQDVTAIRDFMKMLYDRKTGSDSVRYLLLFGDCSYDYKNRISSNTNFVPIYESRESFYPLSSYSSDDYFGFLDNTEGNWSESSPIDNDLMDIGVGRIPVKNAQEASSAVDKLSHYSGSQDCLGKWRNSITFVSDDGDGNLHITDANDLATKVDTTFKRFNVNKVFLDAFPQTPTPGGEKAPEVNAKIDLDVNNGTFILNYSGHGGETGWAQEGILSISQIEGWNNYNTLPFMITATCDFGRYDDPLLVSGAETALVRTGGGSIGLISSTRVVYAFSNKALNLQIYNYIFKPLLDGKMPRLGDVVRQTKNHSISGVNNRNYALLGDPSLQLAYPVDDIAVTKIKGVSVSAIPDTMKALSKVTIQGVIQNTSGTKLTDFNGNLHVTVYDKKSNITTYGTEGGPPFTFSLRNNFLFDGSASVTNGDWSVSFVVPKDISYQYDFGKISVYAEKNATLTDAGGFYTNVIIGGTDPNAPADNTPPGIHLYMNDESFVFGGLTDKNALFLAKLSDENGINTAGSGIGHEIAVTLDNSESPIVLNDFYTANLNDYKNGSVKYPFKDLSVGHHTLRFKAWDTYNNSAESYLEFIVANDEKIALSHILNYPNPFSTHTVFHFDHNRAGEELDVSVQIYTVSGKLIKTLDTKIYSSNSHFSDLDWNGRDDFGDRIGRGVYVYRVWVRAPRDGSSVHKYEKLVILN
jgi:hypothetical protein